MQTYHPQLMQQIQTPINPIPVEGVTQEMIDRTNAKFQFWDNVAQNNLLEEGTEEQKIEIYKSLLDPSIYAYAFFRDPRDISKPFKVFAYQDIILNDPSRYIFFCAANQIGKSISLELKALHCAIMNPGKTYVISSKTFPQTKDVLRQIKQFLTNSTVDYKFDVGDTETKTEIYIRHFEEYEEFVPGSDKPIQKMRELPQSRIICVPATEAALGYAVDGFFVDELAFYENGDHFYKQIVKPRTYFTKGFIMIFSNPNGQQGVAWEIWNNKRFSKYRFNFLDCPVHTQEEFEAEAYDLTREQVDSTLLAIFTSPEGGFLSLEERKQMQEERPNSIPSIITTSLYIFFDFAKTRDRTVRVIGIPIDSEDVHKGIFVYEMKEYPKSTGYDEIVEDLERLCNDIGFGNVAMVGWDNTGVGKGIEDFIKRIQVLGIVISPVEFSLPKKSAMYTTFKFLAERNLKGKLGIKIPRVGECDKQLSKLIFKKTTRDYLQVHHEKESDRDDYPDALAGLCYLIIQPDNPPVTCTIVREGFNKVGKQVLESERHSCGNLLDPGDEFCSFCGEELNEIEEENKYGK